jgi:hypothetical protein
MTEKRRFRYFLCILIFQILPLITLAPSPLKSMNIGENTLYISDDLTFYYNNNSIMLIRDSDTSLLLDNLTDISCWYYESQYIFFYTNNYICRTSLINSKTDTLSQTIDVKSFIYKVNDLYYIDDLGIWKNSNIIAKGNITKFGIGKSLGIFFSSDNTLYKCNQSVYKYIIESGITDFVIDNLGNIIILKNDTIKINNTYYRQFRFTPNKFYTYENNIIIYAEDSIYIYPY